MGKAIDLGGVVFNDYSREVLAEMEEAVLRALERCGREGEKIAKRLVPVDTGNLKNSITHRVDPAEPAAYVGTNNEYAAYVELGTGKYKEGGGGRPGWWVYVKDGSGKSSRKNRGKIYTESEAKRIAAILRSKKLDAYATEGMEPKPYLKPAVADHKQTYRGIIEEELKNG